MEFHSCSDSTTVTGAGANYDSRGYLFVSEPEAITMSAISNLDVSLLDLTNRPDNREWLSQAYAGRKAFAESWFLREK